jgi:hypothetical protein
VAAERFRKMGAVLEAGFEGDVGYGFIGLLEQVMGQLEAFLPEPLVGRGAEDAGKVPFERSQAASRQVGKFVQRQVLGKVIVSYGTKMEINYDSNNLAGDTGTR